MNFVALKNTCLHFLYGSVTRTTERANTHLSHLLVCKLFDAPIQSHTCKPRTHYTNTSTEPKFKSFVYSTEWKCQHTCLCMCTNRTRRLTYVMVRIDTDMNEHESRHQWGNINPTELKMVLIKKQILIIFNDWIFYFIEGLNFPILWSYPCAWNYQVHEWIFSANPILIWCFASNTTGVDSTNIGPLEHLLHFCQIHPASKQFPICHWIQYSGQH